MRHSTTFEFLDDEAKAWTMIAALVCLTVCVWVVSWFAFDHFTPETVRVEKERTNRTVKVLDKLNWYPAEDRVRALEILSRTDLLRNEDLENTGQEGVANNDH